MKEYFKYANGYININDENLFLTHSGNWSETSTLVEKSSKVTIKTNKKYLNYLFILVLIGFGVFDVIKDFKNKTFPFGIVLIALGILAFFKREKGNRYIIPLAKIKTITILNTTAEIIFCNEDELEDCETITAIESKGIIVLEQIKEQFTV